MMNERYKQILNSSWDKTEGPSTEIRQALISDMSEVFQGFAEALISEASLMLTAEAIENDKKQTEFSPLVAACYEAAAAKLIAHFHSTC